MPFALTGGVGAAILQSTENWRMVFTSVHFLLFLPVVVGAYFLLPGRLRRPWLLVASYYFYFFAAPKYLPVLLFGTLFTYVAGRLIGSAKTSNARRGWLAFGVIGCIIGLAFFKYNGFFAAFIAPAFEALGLPYQQKWFTTAAAMGISYYTFTAIGYLIDVSHEDVPAEKNLLTYALFLGFFPSVTQGPISRAGSLLPQLADVSHKFDPQNAADALRLMAIGFFKKLAVADTIGIFVAAVYATPDTLAQYTGLTLVLAAVAFAIQLYFDFSGYTDIALGAAQLLGIKLPPNFNNPHFATNFSGFWSRWHMSLSTWLQDYIFTPLVWSRWTEKLPFIGKKVQKPPVLTSIIIVFMVSGIWHGDTLCFVVWGALQAAYRVGEELLHRFVGKPKKKPPLASRIGKNVVVLVLWVQSLVFFRVGMIPATDTTRAGTVGDAFSALLRQFAGFNLAQAGQDFFVAIQNGFYNDKRIAAAFVLFMVVCTAFALWADWYQCFKLNGKSLVIGMQQMKAAPRWGLYIGLILACFAAFIAVSGGFGGSSFLYGGF